MDLFIKLNFPVNSWILFLGGLDLMVVPGVAFTRDGIRLGHGKGYYDLYLQRLQERYPTSKVYTIGICFAQQIFPKIPFSDHDVFIDEVITAD